MNARLHGLAAAACIGWLIALVALVGLRAMMKVSAGYEEQLATVSTEVADARAALSNAVNRPAPRPLAPVEEPGDDPMMEPAPIEDETPLTRTEVPVPSPGEQEEARRAQQQRMLAGFDRAMDREFSRLDRREAAATTEQERERVAAIKHRLLDLDALWIAVDSQPGPEDMGKLQGEIRSAMGDIIRLSESDRRESLAALARTIGYQTERDIAVFVNEIHRITAETRLDWASLFNRAPPRPPGAGDVPGRVSPGMEIKKTPGEPGAP